MPAALLLPRFPPAAVLSTVPIAIGTYGTAVASLGPLSSTQALVLNTGTYTAALASIHLLRRWRGANDNDDGANKSTVSWATWRAGIELGGYILAGITLQGFGLQRTTVPRAGFLLTLSAIMVPSMEAVLLRIWPSRSILLAGALSAFGVTQLFYAPDAAAGGQTGAGDALVALSAVCYSAHILRLSALAKKHKVRALALAKSTTQLVGTLIVLILALLFRCSLDPAAWMRAVAMPKHTLLAVLWTGLVTCTYPMIAQGYGQAHVSAARASIIYATTPLWNALAAALLVGQRLGRGALFGAALIMAGQVLVVANAYLKAEE